MSKNVLVTGAGGFIGSHLCELLVEKGYEVSAFLRYNSNNSWGWLEDSPYRESIKIINGDIRDYDSVNKAVKSCNSVFHLTALISIPYSYTSPLAYIETNVKGTYNILEASKTNSIQNVLVTSTSETYGTAQYVPIDELHPNVGQSPYSASKIAADHLAISYYKSFDLPVKIVRPFNTYGPRQSARAIIPTIILQILNGKRELNLGNLKPTRDLTFVKDTVKGFFEISKSEKLIGEIINIGMNNEISIENLIKEIIKIMNVDVKITQDQNRVRPEKSEVYRLFCNNEKLINSTGWNPDYNIQVGLENTIKFLKQNLTKYKGLLYNI